MSSYRMMSVAVLVATCVASPASVRQTESIAPPPSPHEHGLPGASMVRFEQNVGQWDARVRFVGRVGGGALVLTDDRMTVSSGGASVAMRLVGARPAAPRGEGELPTKSNFFLGNDPAKWRKGVANFARVRASWRPGIDLVWHGGDRGLEYDLLVDADVDASAIALDVLGARHLRVREDGALEITTPRSTLIEAQPVVVQGGRKLETRFRLDGPARVGFDIEGYQRGLPVLIDPVVLVYSTYLGGSGNDAGGRIALDASGYVYVVGGTDSVDFPTVNPYQASAFGTDVFVAKLGTTGAPPVYATYLGGSGDDYGSAIAVDATGAVYFTGETSSSDFPTKSAYQSSNGGSSDAFVTKLDASGAALVYSTYLGGLGFDTGNAIVLDAAGEAFITGDTNGSNNLATSGAYQTSPGGSADAFVAKLGAAGSTLSYYTYLGGSGGDNGNSLAVDSAGAAYVTGETESANFPVVVGAYQSTLAGTINGFVTKLDATGKTAVYSTYLGGNGDDYPYGMAVAADGTAYVCGNTTSTNFPTANAYQASLGGGVVDAFVARLAATGSSLVYSTYLGGSGEDAAMPIAIDAAGNAYVAGYTKSTDFPTLEPFQATNGGGQDAFVTKLDPTGSALVYSTYLGGSSNDWAAGLVVDGTGAAYVGGNTESADFPTASPAQASSGGGTADVFVAKLGPFPDAGIPDAGPDASVPDGSAADAGDASSGDGSADGSGGQDASVGPPVGSSGCGCTTAGRRQTPKRALFIVAAAVALAALRRRRAARL